MRAYGLKLAGAEPLAEIVAQHFQRHLTEPRQQQRFRIVKGLIERGIDRLLDEAAF